MPALRRAGESDLGCHVRQPLCSLGSSSAHLQILSEKGSQTSGPVPNTFASKDVVGGRATAMIFFNEFKMWGFYDVSFQ